MNRRTNDVSLRKARKDFQNKAVMETLRTYDAELHSEASRLYEESIDFGAHPNHRGVASSARMWKEGDEIVVRNQFLHGDSPALRHSLKATAQVGLNSLMVFRLIFRERFDQLGISEIIESLKREEQHGT